MTHNPQNIIRVLSGCVQHLQVVVYLSTNDFEIYGELPFKNKTWYSNGYLLEITTEHTLFKWNFVGNFHQTSIYQMEVCGKFPQNFQITNGSLLEISTKLPFQFGSLLEVCWKFVGSLLEVCWKFQR